MRYIIISALLLAALSEALMCQHAKPALFRLELTPVDSLQFEINAIPLQIERAYSRYELEKQSLPSKAANSNLRSRLRLCMKSLFQSQRNVTDFLQTKSDPRISEDLVKTYQTRLQSLWYDKKLDSELSPEEIVNLLRSERDVWLKSVPPISTDSEFRADGKAISSTMGRGMSSSPAQTEIKAIPLPATNPHATTSPAIAEEEKVKAAPSLFLIVFVTILGPLIFGITLFLFHRKSR